MHIREDSKTEHGVSWRIQFNAGEVFIIAKNLETERKLIGEYECEFNYLKGYSDDDLLEIYRLTDEFVERLRNG